MRFIIFFLLLSLNISARQIFVKNSGNDINNGLSAENAIATIGKLNTIILLNDTVNFNRSDTFLLSVPLRINVKITVTNYGTGALPVLTSLIRVNSFSYVSPFVYESVVPVSTLATLKGIVIDSVSTWVPMGRYPNANAANGGFLNYTTTGNNTKVKVPGIAGIWDSAAVVIRVEKYVIAIQKVVNQTVDTITYTPIFVWLPTNNFGLFFQDHPGTLDSQNEWFYNQTTKKLRIYSQTAPGSPSNISVPTCDTLIAIAANNIVIDGLQLIGSNRKSIAKINSGAYTSVKIINCIINFSGEDAIDFKVGNNTGLVVEDNTISNSNNVAVIAGAGCANATINHNTILNSGNIIGMAPDLGLYSAIQTGGKATNVLYNTVENTGYNAIQIQLDSSKANNNWIKNFAFVKDDGAALYTYTGSSNTEYFGREFKNNIIQNGVGVVFGVGSNPKPAAEGIYLDDNTSGFIVDGNTVDSSNKSGILLHNARNSTITNNLFFNCAFGLAISDDGLGADVTGLTIKQNKFVAKYTTQYVATFYSTQNNVAGFGTIDSNIYTRPLLESATIKMEFPNYPWGYRTLQVWQTYSNKDAGSTISNVTVSSVNQFDLKINPTNSILNYVFPGISKRSISNTIFNNNANISSWGSNLFFPNGTTYNPLKMYLITK